jgi:protein-disulfide isomerase
MGLDMARLEKELAGPAVAEAIRQNMALADKLGLSGTPAFIIGGEVVPGAVGVEPLRQAIENVRACGKSRC